MTTPHDDAAPSVVKTRLTVSPEVARLVELAQEHLEGSTGRPANKTEALDWLLRDLCDYGSAVVGAWAREVWPDSVETREWHRKRDGRRGLHPAVPGVGE